MGPWDLALVMQGMNITTHQYKRNISNSIHLFTNNSHSDMTLTNHHHIFLHLYIILYTLTSILSYMYLLLKSLILIVTFIVRGTCAIPFLQLWKKCILQTSGNTFLLKSFRFKFCLQNLKRIHNYYKLINLFINLIVIVYI